MRLGFFSVVVCGVVWVEIGLVVPFWRISSPARVAGGIVPILSFVYWVEFAVLRKI
jgi:hypothetical protein